VANEGMALPAMSGGSKSASGGACFLQWSQNRTAVAALKVFSPTDKKATNGFRTKSVGRFFIRWGISKI
jgi:hypothetical protein